MRGYCSAGAQAWQEGARNPCIDPPVRPYRIRTTILLTTATSTCSSGCRRNRSATDSALLGPFARRGGAAVDRLAQDG